MEFKKRRDEALSQFEKTKQDLEILNRDIDDQILSQTEDIKALQASNKELESLKVANGKTIKNLLNFLK